MLFHPLPRLVVFIFFVFESTFISDASSLQPYCQHSSCFELPFYLEASFCRETLHLTLLLYGHKLYYVRCLSIIGFLLTLASLVLCFLMHRPTWCLSLYHCVSVSIIVFQSLSLCLSLYHCVSVSIIVSQSLSLCFSLYHCVSN